MVRKITAVILAASFLISCTTTISGRKQLHLLPESQLQAMASQQYRSFLSQNRVVSASRDRDAEMVRRVGQRLTSAVTSYLRSKGAADQLEGYKWEYNLVDNKEANAWCMPGGKIVVYTGLLPYTRNEAALAIVVGHEIMHAVLQHGNARMSQGLLQQLGATGLSVALAQKPQQTQNILMQAYGVGSTVFGILPFSRRDESEADHYGLIIAAIAGYNPQEAVPFWQRMASQNKSKPPAFLSSHPSDAQRIADIKKWMPEAMSYYRKG
jgi:predicted Zn-dependent protease